LPRGVSTSAETFLRTRSWPSAWRIARVRQSCAFWTARVACVLAILFNVVTIAYPGRAEPVIDGADLAISPGDTLTLVGSNGAGKTSLLALVLKFIEPARGTVSVGGMDLAAAPDDRWRRQIGWLPQHRALFPWPIAENIEIGDRCRCGLGRQLHHRAAERLRDRTQRAGNAAVRRSAADQVTDRLRPAPIRARAITVSLLKGPGSPPVGRPAGHRRSQPPAIAWPPGWWGSMALASQPWRRCRCGSWNLQAGRPNSTEPTCRFPGRTKPSW
jgi:ABC-type uncharacterized transport system YnjBCD ATPase subunit